MHVVGTSHKLEREIDKIKFRISTYIEYSSDLYVGMVIIHTLVNSSYGDYVCLDLATILLLWSPACSIHSS